MGRAVRIYYDYRAEGGVELTGSLNPPITRYLSPPRRSTSYGNGRGFVVLRAANLFCLLFVVLALIILLCVPFPPFFCTSVFPCLRADRFLGSRVLDRPSSADALPLSTYFLSLAGVHGVLWDDFGEIVSDIRSWTRRCCIKGSEEGSTTR